MKVENKQINQKKQDSEGMSSDNPSEFLKTSRIMKKTFLFLVCIFGALYGYAQLVVKSNGKVGIGTNNPSEMLDVRVSSSPYSYSAARFQGGTYCVSIYNQITNSNVEINGSD